MRSTIRSPIRSSIPACRGRAGTSSWAWLPRRSASGAAAALGGARCAGCAHRRRRGVLAFCGVVGLGGCSSKGTQRVAQLRAHANDPRWRVREAVAMALQHWGGWDFGALAAAMSDWAQGSWLERRAAAAGLCEPVLLTDLGRVQAVLAVLEEATAGVTGAARDERRSEQFKALRKGLGYCWSVCRRGRSPGWAPSRSSPRPARRSPSRPSAEAPWPRLRGHASEGRWRAGLRIVERIEGQHVVVEFCPCQRSQIRTCSRMPRRARAPRRSARRRPA